MQLLLVAGPLVRSSTRSCASLVPMARCRYVIERAAADHALSRPVVRGSRAVPARARSQEPQRVSRRSRRALARSLRVGVSARAERRGGAADPACLPIQGTNATARPRAQQPPPLICVASPPLPPVHSRTGRSAPGLPLPRTHPRALTPRAPPPPSPSPRAGPRCGAARPDIASAPRRPAPRPAGGCSIQTPSPSRAPHPTNTER
jgi:hypothetical protein